MQSEKVNWGGLATYVVHDLSAGEQPRLAVVLCHGYGAQGNDLVGLAQPLLAAAGQVGRKVALVFPAAPLDLGEEGLPGGRAWWPVDLDRLINRRTPELLAQFRKVRPQGLIESRELLVSLLDDAGRRFHLTADRFVLGGFSQGAMLTTDVALRLKKRPAGLCILSGALINEEEWRPLASEMGRLAVLQSHGQHDSILTFGQGMSLNRMLIEGGADVEFLPFAGDHEIPLPVLHRLAHFIATLSA